MEKKSRKEKSVFLIDFSKPCPIDDDELFVKDSKNTTLLPASKVPKSSHAKYLLPQDMRYTVPQLFQLFLKPKLEFKLNNAGVADVDSDDGIHFSVSHHLIA